MKEYLSPKMDIARIDTNDIMITSAQVFNVDNATGDDVLHLGDL